MKNGCTVRLGGITNQGLAYDTIAIRPYIPATMTTMRATTDSRYGLIVLQYERTADGFDYTFTIPANSVANITIPVTAGLRLTENGQEPHRWGERYHESHLQRLHGHVDRRIRPLPLPHRQANHEDRRHTDKQCRPSVP